MKKIIDISKHQGNIDFNKMKKTNIDGIMCRCSYSGFKDSRFEEYYSKIIENNIPLGVYAYCTWHYSSFSVNRASAMISAESESNKLLQILKNKKITGPVAIDLEFESGQSTLLSKDEMTYVANYYLSKIKDAGYSPILYCSISWLFEHLNPEQIQVPLWIAYYHKDGFKGSSFPNTKYGNLMNLIKDRIFMWQYTSNGDGNLYGVSSQRIDINHCYRNFGTTCTYFPYDKPRDNTKIYTVKKNDNLTKISNTFGISLDTLIKNNPQIKNPNLIHVGDTIYISKSHPTSDIKIGSVVRVKKGAKTFDNKPISRFVYKNSYIVDELKGNRAVLDLKGICTPINIKDLKVV